MQNTLTTLDIYFDSAFAQITDKDEKEKLRGRFLKLLFQRVAIKLTQDFSGLDKAMLTTSLQRYNDNKLDNDQMVENLTQFVSKNSDNGKKIITLLFDEASYLLKRLLG